MVVRLIHGSGLPNGCLRLGQWVNQKRIFLNNLIGDQVLLDNAFNDVWHGAVIPDAIWIDHKDRPLLANSQAIGLGTKNAGGLFSRDLI